MKRLAILLALTVSAAASAADWRGGPTTSDGAITSLDPRGVRAAYWVFVNGDSTTTTGPVLRTAACDKITVTTFWNGATAAVKLYASNAGVGSTGLAITNLPQITTDFDADGVPDADALDQTSIAKSGLRDFMAAGIVPTITGACSTGTCALEVLCAGSAK